MRTLLLVPCLALLALGSSPAPGAPEAAGPGRSLALTIYNDNLALVKDRRTLDFPRGSGEIRFADVAAQIDPTSVHFETVDDAGAAQILEQNYQYDLVSAERLLQKYVDAPLEVLTKDGKLHAGTLLSSEGGTLLLREGEGLVSLARDQVLEVRYGKLPGGLITRPTLAWRVESRGGSHPAELRYLTTGISWHAEYVAVASEAGDRMDLAGWVSIDNQSGATYDDARLKLVAGDVHRAEEPQAVQHLRGGRALMAAEAQPQFQEESFSEYHLYTLTRPATVADREVKQLALFPTTRLKSRKVYTYDGERDPRKVRVTLEARNSQADGLGIPLPKGKVRVYQEDASRSLQFAGEDLIDHTPKDEMVRLYIGNAFDVVGERKQTDMQNVSDRTRQSSFEIRVRNHKQEAVPLVVVEHAWGDWYVTTSSPEYRKRDAYTLEFPITVAANSEAVVRYTLRQTW
ncbi:MAG TPA: DUF4139 domain-containing protein [Candidatus Saccharimonadales bacterium]|nr:DUF4139 domain-containing protein [Candidatus Saccharimonadales bacterium]